MKKRVGFIGIIIQNREKYASRINEILSGYGDIILARTGVPRAKEEYSIISLIVEATTDQVGALTGKLGNIEGVEVKSALSKN